MSEHEALCRCSGAAGAHVGWSVAAGAHVGWSAAAGAHVGFFAFSHKESLQKLL